MSNERGPFRHDPNSMDSMFSRILERLDAQDRMHANTRLEQAEESRKILEQVENMDRRTTLLERWKDVSDARATWIGGAVALVVSFGGWLIEHFGGKPSS